MKESYYKLLGEKIRDLRKRAGLTQVELCQQSGVSQGELSSFESRGDRIRSADRINAILDALGYELSVSEKKTTPIFDC